MAKKKPRLTPVTQSPAAGRLALGGLMPIILRSGTAVESTPLVTIATEAEHQAVSGGADGVSAHFTKTWSSSGGWDNSGYMRWRVTATADEDDDGYWIPHANQTEQSIYLSFISRVGSTWWTSHSSSDNFKLVMFYNTGGGNPRPTIFNKAIYRGGPYYYRTFAPDLEAGDAGTDPYTYPNHPYKEGSDGHSEWWFVVMGLVGSKTKVYLWNQSGTVSGLYAESRDASTVPGLLESWNAATWSVVRLLGYVEATTAGDANAYMDIGRITINTTLPSPPAGFVTG